MSSRNAPASNEHAPALGLAHRILGRVHVTGVFWYRFAYWGFTRLPSWTDWFSVPIAAAFFFLVLKNIRDALAANLEPVMGPTGRWGRLRRSWLTIWEFAWCFAERYRRISDPHLFHAVLEGEEHWRAISESPTGAIVVTAHIGPWETAAQFGATASNRRIHVVREKEMDQRAQDFVREILTRAGPNYIAHFSGDDPTLSFELADALRRGDIVALQCDRPRAGGRTVVASLFGRPMPLPIGPAALARATGAPIVPIFNFRDGRFKTRVVARKPFHVARTADRSADIAEAVHYLASQIEAAIRERPHQWFCFRRLWSEGSSSNARRRVESARSKIPSGI